MSHIHYKYCQTEYELLEDQTDKTEEFLNILREQIQESNKAWSRM